METDKKSFLFEAATHSRVGITPDAQRGVDVLVATELGVELSPTIPNSKTNFNQKKEPQSPLNSDIDRS